MTIREFEEAVEGVDENKELTAFIHIGNKTHVVKNINDVRPKAVDGECIVNIYCEASDFDIVLKR